MAGHASLAKLNTLSKKLETAQNRIKKIREVADDKVQHVVRTTEVGASALVLGVVMGKYGESAETIAGIPTGLGVAAVCHGLGLIGVGGEMSSHLHAFGDGALATFAAGFGKQIGEASRAGLPMGQAVKHALAPGNAPALKAGVQGMRLSEAEMNAINKV